MARLTRREKLYNLLMDTYRELYANCTVPVDFDELVANAEIMEDGRKKIPYEDYFIDDNLYKAIVDKNMKKMRLSKSEKAAFSMQAYLGCGPCSIRENRANIEQEIKDNLEQGNNE